MLSWNLFHGRDRAPDASLHTWASRLLRRSERGATHAQVNRDLFDAFTGVLAGASWDIALLQECPPRWAEDLATACEATPHLVLTARNLPGPLSAAQHLAARLSPDLIASWEGGSNLTLVRSASPRRRIVSERRELTLARRPETRRMAFTRLEPGLCIANLHASTALPAAEREVLTAADVAVAWAADEPLVLGGDLNLAPGQSSHLFDQLRVRHGIEGPGGAEEIDHILSRGLQRLEPTRRWEPAEREVPEPAPREGRARLAIRLSDHAPVEAAFELSSSA